MMWLINTRQNWGWGQLDLLIGIKNFDGSIDVVQTPTLKRYDRNMAIEKPTIEAGSQYDGKDFLQACVDHAYSIGIIPIGTPTATKEIEAIKYHLEDMRKLAFK